jgi:hypothetical protein
MNVLEGVVAVITAACLALLLSVLGGLVVVGFQWVRSW